MDQPKVERMLRLMMMLTGNANQTIDDIASKLDMSKRTVYRYIDTFRNAGFVIKNNNGVFKIDKSSAYFKDISELVHFSEEEAFILKQSIDAISDASAITQNLKKKLATVYDYKILADITVNKQNSRNVQALSTAITDELQVMLVDYQSASSNSITTRLVEPFRFTTNFVQVWCYEPATNSNKLFKVARIGSVDLLTGWQFKQNHNAGFIDLFRINSEVKIPITLLLSVRAANLLMEEYPLSAKQITRISELKWELKTEVCGFEGVGRFIMGLYDEIEIVNSPELKAYIANRIVKMAKTV